MKNQEDTSFLKNSRSFLLTAGGCFLYFCLSFIYNGLRPLKITLVTSASSAGAEIIPFLKICGVLPGALFFTFLYTRLCEFFTRKQIFNTFVLIFLGYFFLFALLFYPQTDFFALKTLSGFLQGVLPSGLRGLVAMIEFWHVSLFYVLCEVWSSAVMFVLFWGLMNETSTMDEASKTYPFYNLFGNLAAAVSGLVIHKLSFLNLNISFLASQSSVYCCYFINIMICIVFGVVAAFVFQLLSSKRKILKSRVEEKKKKDSEKPKYSFSESLVMVLKSRYLFCLLVLSISYNAIFTLFDTLWSQSVKDYFGSNQLDIVRFLADIQITKGVLSTLLAFCVPFLIRKLGWRKSALITPMFLLASGFVFFPLYFFQESEFLKGFFYDAFGLEVIWILAYCGGIQNALSRGSKYSIYDTTKEMAFIPLPLEQKRKGKAIIDGVASRMGKASGAVLFMLLLPLCTSLSATVPYLAVASCFVLVAWIYSVAYLDKHIKKQK